MKEKFITLTLPELAYTYSLIQSQCLGAVIKDLKESESLSDFKINLMGIYYETQIFTLDNPSHISKEKTTEIRKAVFDALHQLIETLESSEYCEKGMIQ